MNVIVFDDDLGACFAAHTYRKLIRRGEVVVVSRSKTPGYARSLLPYYAVGLLEEPFLISGRLLETSDLVRIVSASDVVVEEKYEISVKRRVYTNPLVLISVWPELAPSDDRTINLLYPEDAEELSEKLAYINDIVVTGGIAALPLVDALLNVGVKPKLVWHTGEFDEDFTGLLTKRLETKGVKLVPEIPSHYTLIVNFGGGWIPSNPFLKRRAEFVQVDALGKALVNDALYAIGLATMVKEPEGIFHTVRSEEEVLLQAFNFAMGLVDMRAPSLRRYYAARLDDVVFASFGFTQKEAAELKLNPVVTRIRGWGRWSNTVIKAIASKQGLLLGVQAQVDAESSILLGMLYHAVVSRAKIDELARAFCPLDPQAPSLGDPLSRTFQALLRKIVMGKAGRRVQHI
ncbi:MAG: NAD(P)/FAD-dependent oxidoreductase [Thermofilaceae archaeon]|nr:NAD(P)/FAD-dependent oxidoreductase [Thermofilaceae archaeon]MDW8003762.1 FAD/NAD(P)-binding oxidoreductase [Thermofilaceae archaeon]